MKGNVFASIVAFFICKFFKNIPQQYKIDPLFLISIQKIKTEKKKQK